MKDNKDRDEVLAAVKQNGWALEDADESLQKDREIVMAAVKQDGSALEYADDTLKADREVVLAAVKQSDIALPYASELLQKDEELRKMTTKEALKEIGKIPMISFTVTWRVDFDDASYTTDEVVEAENLDALFDELNEGLEENRWTPEMNVPAHSGDFNIEYVVIRSPGGKELYRDDDK